jgi:hypothetical protein
VAQSSAATPPSKQHAANGITTATWSGPGNSSFGATLVVFRNDRMISFGLNGQ